MKLSALIKRLQNIQTTLKKDPSVVVDFDPAIGWYDVESITIEENIDMESMNTKIGEFIINIKSSNEL